MRVVFFIFITIFLTGCGSRKKNITTSKKTSKEISQVVLQNAKTDQTSIIPIFNNTSEYIEFFKAKAINEMQLFGIPASITLAQGILESGSGRGRLATQANNHFGIKCHDWTGPRIFHDDDTEQECFRKYDNPNQSYRDHSLFLANRRRYENLFRYNSNDYKSWAKGLKKAGYATDPKYAHKLIALIERYELYRYDKKNKINKTQYEFDEITYTVIKGDTLYSISKRYNTSVEAIKLVNKLSSDKLEIGQKLKIVKE